MVGRPYSPWATRRNRGHAGIVNTVRYARKLTGHHAIAATVGGFHLKTM